MSFDPARPDPALLARVSFGDAWLGLTAPPAPADPHDVRVRLAMYRLLVEGTSSARAFGAGDALSPFWGYASQLDWQHRTGRLGGPGFAIDPASWWGACNYALSVVPYRAAMELGLVPALAFAAPPADYRAALAAWRTALAALAAARAGDDHDPLRLAVWRAHLASIDAAVRRHAADHARLPALERRFAAGWVRMVELFGAAGWRTDLAVLAEHGAGALPSHILDDAALAALPAAERRTARQVLALADRPAWRWTLEAAAWRRIMRSRAARDDAARILAALLGRGRRAWPTRARALVHALFPVGN